MAKSPSRKSPPRSKAAKPSKLAKPAKAAKRTKPPERKPAKASPASRPVRPSSKSGHRPPSSSLPPTRRSAATQPPFPGGGRAAPPPLVVLPDSAHGDAVAVYERGLQALQSKQYDKAIQLLQSVLDLYADEKELHERARLYLNVALRHSRPPDSTPRSADERIYAATLLLNAGRYDEALSQLSALERDDPPNDHVQFVLAMVHLHRGEFSEAMRHLVRAVELNPANRNAALQDAELAPLRDEADFRDAIEAAAARGRRLASRATR